MAPARPYRDFLTPALHRRFASASLTTLVACYAIAILMGDWNNAIWIFMPLGPVGVRTALLFIPSMVVYVLRVAQMHVGERSTATPFKTFTMCIFRIDTIRTIMAYTISAWVFGEVYIWSRSPSARLDYTDPGKLHERIRLNERPIFLRSMFFLLGISQAIIHLAKDYDRVPVLIPEPRHSLTNGGSTKPATRSSPNSQIISQLSDIAWRSLRMAAVIVLVGPALYFAGIRSLLWNWHYSFAKHLVSLPKATRPAGLGGLADLLGKFIVEGSYLVLLWEVSNATFDVYMSQEPLKKDKPITDDSKDPNGSLLNGLRSKREVPKNIAFWELALITERFSHRRQSIYQEDERRNGPTWKQVVDVCLGEIRDINSRIKDQQPPELQANGEGEKKPASVQLVPRISSPLKDGKITEPIPPAGTRLQKFETFASDLARVHSSPGNAANAQARKLLDSGTSTLNQGMQSSVGFFGQHVSTVLQSFLGTMFQNSSSRIANVVISGSPYSRAGLINCAIQALTRLAVLSLKEDSLGQFHKEIPEVIRVFSTTIKNTEDYLKRLSLSLAELDLLGASNGTTNQANSVSCVVDALKDGLEKILNSFAEYLPNMNISRNELREAKELAVTRGSHQRV